MRMGLNAWFMKIMKATMKCSVRDLELRSFCLDVDFKAVLFLASKFTTSFLETRLLFCILTPGRGHEAGKSHQMGGSCRHIDAELEADCILSRLAQRSFGMLQCCNGHII